MKQIAGYHFTFQYNRDFLPGVFQPNIGVYTIAPSNLTRKIVRVWKSILHNLNPAKYGVAVDQTILRNLLSSGRVIHTPLSHHFIMTGTGKSLINRPILVRFFDGLDMTSYYHVRRMNSEMAIQVKNSRPYVMHLSFLLGIDRKLLFMKCAGYNFIDTRNRCSILPSNITFSNLLDSVHIKACKWK
jgi:hypothetical protein